MKIVKEDWKELPDEVLSLSGKVNNLYSKLDSIRGDKKLLKLSPEEHKRYRDCCLEISTLNKKLNKFAEELLKPGVLIELHDRTKLLIGDLAQGCPYPCYNSGDDIDFSKIKKYRKILDI